MSVPESMAKLFAYVDGHKEEYIDNLAKAVKIKSVSAWPETRGEITKMVEWVGAQLKPLGTSVEYADVGMQTLHDGTQLPLPPVLMGQLGNDPAKKTVLLYGHLDVQPVSQVLEIPFCGVIHNTL